MSSQLPLDPFSSSSYPTCPSSSSNTKTSSTYHKAPSTSSARPLPAFSRPPSSYPVRSETRYPPLINPSSSPSSSPSPSRRPASPSTPPPFVPRGSSRPLTPSTLFRAANTAPPVTPPQQFNPLHSTPTPTFRNAPFPSQDLTDGGVELTPIRRQPHRLDSPFDDRHSVILSQEEMSALTSSSSDDVEYIGGKARTYSNYKFASTSPRLGRGYGDNQASNGLGIDTKLQETRPVSEVRRSIYLPAGFTSVSQATLDKHTHLASPVDLPIVRSSLPPVKPSFLRLFTIVTPRQCLLYLVPAIAFSVASAAVPPYMTLIIGETYAAYEAFPSDTKKATAEEKSALMSEARTVCLKLAVAGALALIFNYFKSVTWIRFSEIVTDRLRKMFYQAVVKKDMEWFDLGMGMNQSANNAKGKHAAAGAGGLMMKFARESDEVRTATAVASGNSLQYFVSFFACFILAMMKQPLLALVTLSSIPFIVVVNIFTQVKAEPMYRVERRAFAEASTNVERATAAIATVKVHNAQSIEQDRFRKFVMNARESLLKQAILWATCLSLSDFFLLAIFVIGFWYGAQVVHKSETSVGNVMTVFWACLLASSYLQSIVPQLSTITKGKTSLASLLTIIQDARLRPTSSTSSRDSALKRNSLRKIRPGRCRGEVTVRNVTFAYPTRPHIPVVRDVSLFLPSGETTFIVGGSGSGKSTIAQLLLRLYQPTSGDLCLDDQSLAFLDEDFMRHHIAAIQQDCFLFDMSVHDNVAMGLSGAPGDRQPINVTRNEVIQACKMAYIDDFIESLPEGYETKLGTSGSQLSGGQRQRIAIARARIRNPTILILDEATSALDATSRVLVFDAIRQWRKNQTTIVITHDLSQITSDDFVYVLKDGVVLEQGFRSELVRRGGEGVFFTMAMEQAIEPLPQTVEVELEENIEEIISGVEDDEKQIVTGSTFNTSGNRLSLLRPHTPSFQVDMRPSSALYLNILDEYSRGIRTSMDGAPLSVGQGQSFSGEVDAMGRPMSLAQKRLSWGPQDLDRSYAKRTSVISRPASRLSHRASVISDATHVLGWDKAKLEVKVDNSLNNDLVITESKDIEPLAIATTAVESAASGNTKNRSTRETLFKLMSYLFHTIPNKQYLVLGIVGAIGHGIGTPIWASFVSKLMALVGSGASQTSLVTQYGAIGLGVCAGQSIADWMQEYFLYRVAAEWTAAVRIEAFGKVMRQDKAWFDESDNSPAKLVQCLIKDAEDMRNLMSVIIGRAVVFVTMIGLGLGWAMVIGWRLTLVGIALGPVFGILVVVGEKFTNKAEVINKERRESLAKIVYEAISNIRGIRAMALEATFDQMFEAEAEKVLKTGHSGAWSKSISVGSTASIPLFAQALLNYVGATFMKANYMNYATMLEVFTMVLFSLTFGSQMLNFLPMLAKASVAARDFNRLFALANRPLEEEGELRFPITGNVQFDRVSFTYPTRPDVPVLKDLSITFTPGECVAIVGPSGCGKSTVAALLQRLYEPSSGAIRMDRFSLGNADTKWLRNHIAVVSQSANLFDASVADNIAYGSTVPFGEIQRAAQAANIHEFIQALPQGYDTKLGENASLISGGQAQRLQIARALVRRSNILILDECTSALDVENARAVVDTILKIKDARTTIFITHSIEAMKRCDRIVCMEEGRVVDDGTFEELMARGGAFAHLMRTGEWE